MLGCDMLAKEGRDLLRSISHLRPKNSSDGNWGLDSGRRTAWDLAMAEPIAWVKAILDGGEKLWWGLFLACIGFVLAPSLLPSFVPQGLVKAGALLFGCLLAPTQAASVLETVRTRLKSHRERRALEDREKKEDEEIERQIASCSPQEVDILIYIYNHNGAPADVSEQSRAFATCRSLMHRRLIVPAGRRFELLSMMCSFVLPERVFNLITLHRNREEQRSLASADDDEAAVQADEPQQS